MWPKGHCGCSVRVDEVGNGHLEPGDQPQPRPRPPLRTFADGDPASRSPRPAPCTFAPGPRRCWAHTQSALHTWAEVTLERKSHLSGRNRGKGGKREEAAFKSIMGPRVKWWALGEQPVAQRPETRLKR